MLLAPQWVHGGALVGVKGVKPMKNFDLYTFEGQINDI